MKTPLLNAMERMYIEAANLHPLKYYLISWQTKQRLLEELKSTLANPPKNISSYRGIAVLTVMEFPPDRIELI